MKNRNKILGFFAIAMVVLIHMSCEKYHGDSYNFSDTKGNYIIFGSTSSVQVVNKDTDQNGKHVQVDKKINLQTRMNLPYEVEYSYVVAVDGGSSATLSGTYRRDTTAYPLTFTTTDAMFGNKDSITGSITLKSATGKYGDLTVGYPDSTTGITVKFKAYKPGT